MSKKMTQGLMALAVVLLVVYALKVQGLVEFNDGKEGAVDVKKSKKCKCKSENKRLDIVKKCYPTFVKCMGK
mgnify:FL=1